MHAAQTREVKSRISHACDSLRQLQPAESKKCIFRTVVAMDRPFGGVPNESLVQFPMNARASQCVDEIVPERMEHLPPVNSQSS